MCVVALSNHLIDGGDEMTQMRVRWSSVLFGFGMTFLVAIMPIVYIFIASPTPDGKTRDVAANPDAIGMSVSGISPIDGVPLALFVGAIAIMAIIGVIAVFSRSQRYTA